jgi:hypothetical protein
MAYIGKTPTVGNFQVCDAISVVNGQAAYTLQVGGTNVTPETANHMLVSLNGVLQKPGSSFTIAGSTMTFASNLATGDVIDFVVILGDVLNIGTPSDDTVTAAKLNDNIISGQTALTSAPDDTDELLISDAGTLKRIDFSLLKSTPGLNLISTTTVSSSSETVNITSGIDSTYKRYVLQYTNVHVSASAPTMYGKFYVDGSVTTGSDYIYAAIGRHSGSSTITWQSTGNASFRFNYDQGNDNDMGINGSITLFDPSNTTFTTSFYIENVDHQSDDRSNVAHVGGRLNLTGAVTGIRFDPSSGNIDSGTFKLYGIS